MTKALLLAAALTLVQAAEPETEAWGTIADMAAALSEPNPVAFMKPVAKSFEKYGYLEREVRALCMANDVVSSITPVSNTGDNDQRTLELDWYLQIHSQGDTSKSTERRQTITAQLIRVGKRWQVTSLTPIEFFAHPNL